MSTREEIGELASEICGLVAKFYHAEEGKPIPVMDAILAIECAKQFYQMESISEYLQSGARAVAKRKARDEQGIGK